MGSYLYSVNAPKTALSVNDATTGEATAIALLSYWYKPFHGWSDDPLIKRQDAMHARTVGVKEAAWRKAGKPIPSLAVNEGDYKELKAGNVEHVTVYVIYGVCMCDDSSPVGGKLVVSANGTLVFEPVAR